MTNQNPRVPTVVIVLILAAGVLLAGPTILLSILLDGPGAGIVAAFVFLLFFVSFYIITMRRLE